MSPTPQSWTRAAPGGPPRCGRFAPSTTGPAHLGTLLSALLAWCDVRRFGGRLLLRLEDLDPARCRPAYAERLVEQLAWLGLDFDHQSRQSAHRARHLAALSRLAATGALYACSCSRRLLRDGAPHPCAATPVDAHSWAATALPLRLRLGRAASAGDPIVRRRDGAVAYLLASVVDDAAEGVSHVVRGRDLEPLVPLQAAIYRHLGAPPPLWRHHLLLCHRRGHKLAKLHGDGGDLGRGGNAGPEATCGWLAWAAGLRPTPAPLAPAALAADFGWDRLRREDFCQAPPTGGREPHR